MRLPDVFESRSDDVDNAVCVCSSRACERRIVVLGRRASQGRRHAAAAILKPALAGCRAGEIRADRCDRAEGRRRWGGRRDAVDIARHDRSGLNR